MPMWVDWLLAVLGQLPLAKLINTTMRAAEFMRALADIIEKLDGNESSESQPKNPEEKDPNPIMVSPLQQELELDKAEAGKDSPIIRKLTQDETEHNPNNPIFRSR